MTSLLQRALRLAGFRKQSGAAVPLAVPVNGTGWVNAREFVNDHYYQSLPLRLFTVPRAGTPRVSIVTDSINRGSLYGGVGTAIIMGALLAESKGARLRIVTRLERPQPAGLEEVLRIYGIELPTELELAHAPYKSTEELDTFAGELFITTSWWTTASTVASVPSECVVYLLQEDERMFYPYGDGHLLCAQLLRRPDIRIVVNAKLLFDHMVESGLADLTTRGLWFEPAFPSSVFYPRPPEHGATNKRTLMFYARPNNLRNLFLFGVKLIETAITRGILDLDAWDIVLVGKDLQQFRFDDGRYRPRQLENLSWGEYAELVGQVDLGLSLMYTPHPSYPTFDLAASGAVVVTNRFGAKQNLDRYSKNIICGDLDIRSMLEALDTGLKLACRTEEREANHRANGFCQDWRTSFAHVLRDLDNPA